MYKEVLKDDSLHNYLFSNKLSLSIFRIQNRFNTRKSTLDANSYIQEKYSIEKKYYICILYTNTTKINKIY